MQNLKEIINIRVEFYEIQVKKIEKINNTRHWLFEKTSKMDKLLVRVFKKKKRETERENSNKQE